MWMGDRGRELSYNGVLVDRIRVTNRIYHIMIGIIDYGMGNLRSVEKAFQHLGFDAKVLKNPSELGAVTHAVLPGVGAFGDAMANLNKGGWSDPIKAFVAEDKPFLGICLGMQLLFDSSDEGRGSDSGAWAFVGEGDCV